MKAFRLIADYLYLSRQQETETDNTMIRTMHRINRVSLFLFLLSLMILASRLIAKALLQ